MESNLDRQNIIDGIVKHPGVVVIVGDTDTGKTTLARQIIEKGTEAGLSTAIVDADMGQSEIGPPGAISMATIDHFPESFKTLHPRRMYFTGSTTPVGHMLPTVIGTRRMVDEATARGAGLIVVDTSGLVKGAIGRDLKLYKIDLISPPYIIGLAKSRELDPILSVLSRIEKYKVYKLPVSAEVKTKQKEFRAARRQAQFHGYFQNASRHFIRLDDIVCSDTYFTTGRPVKWQHFRVLEKDLNVRVLHAEVVDKGMYIVVDRKPEAGGVEALMKRYGTRDFTVVCGSDFTNLLVGLADANNNIIDLGIIEAIDFKQRHIAVVTPATTITPVRIVQFGYMRVRPDGIELGKIKL
ncbi:MAG: Clp1/GlmU family protein [Armatimonadota bacterium]